MFQTLLTEERIQRAKSVSNWKEAIRIASQPLIQDGSIKESYVDAMIEAAIQFGPYIVLTDGFAMPHAQGTDHVNRLAISFLILEKPVDLLGESVDIFMVLATPDATAHIDVLMTLANVLAEEEKLAVLRSGDLEAIYEL